MSKLFEWLDLRPCVGSSAYALLGLCVAVVMGGALAGAYAERAVAEDAVLQAHAPKTLESETLESVALETDVPQEGQDARSAPSEENVLAALG